MERIGSLLPVGSGDQSLHHGARRRSRRYPINADVEVIEPVRSTGVALNASAGGLRVFIDRELPLGEECVIEVHFTPTRHSSERSRVVWCRKIRDGWVVGLEFVDIDWTIPTSPFNRAA